MTELVEQYGNDMLRLALLYLGAKEQAEDAVQDSLIKIYRCADRDKICRAFVMRVLVNTCKDYHKSGWARSVCLVDELPEPQAADPQQAQQQELGALRQGILALPQKYREVILLRYDQDMPVGGIARVLGVPQPTVSVRLRRAYHLLQKRLEGVSCEDY